MPGKERARWTVRRPSVDIKDAVPVNEGALALALQGGIQHLQLEALQLAQQLRLSLLVEMVVVKRLAVLNGGCKAQCET